MVTASKGIRPQLSHAQFYQVVETVKAHRDGLGKKESWNEFLNFLYAKLAEAGHTFYVSSYSAKEACKIVGIQLRFKRQAGKGKGDKSRYQDSIDILARALHRVMTNLGEPIGPGIERLYALANKKEVPAAVICD